MQNWQQLCILAGEYFIILNKIKFCFTKSKQCFMILILITVTYVNVAVEMAWVKNNVYFLLCSKQDGHEMIDRIVWFYF